MKRAPYFVTATGTGAGKTLLTALLARFLRGNGLRVAALKPVCSGGRDDARTLAAALAGELTLDEINPWHFRAAVAPVLAARREKQQVSLPQIVAYVRPWQKRYDWLLIEGAGGLLSPLGEKVDSRGVIAALRATPIIVAPNRLGVINDLRLTLAALPPAARSRTTIVLMSPPQPDAATRTNAALLAEYFDAGRIICLPWLGEAVDLDVALKNGQVRRLLGRVTAAAAEAPNFKHQPPVNHQ